MIRRILLGTGLIGALAGAFLLGSVTLRGVYAADNSPATPAATSPSAGSTAPDQAEQSGQSEQPDQAGDTGQDEGAALQAKAKLTSAEATSAALAQFPGSTVTSAKLENENGLPVYNVKLTDTTGKAQEVKVDAVTGVVLPADATGSASGQSQDNQSQSGPNTDATGENGD